MAGHVYIGSFTSAGGRGLTAATVDPDTGALTALGHTADVPNPSFLALSPDGRTLYAVSETEPEGAAAAFSLADPAAPKLLGDPVPVHGGSPTHLAVHQGHLLTANYAAPGSVSVLSLNEDGSLGRVRSVLEHEGDGPNQERQEAPHAHAVLTDPSGRWALSVDLGTDSVRVCELEAGSDELEIERELGLRSGIGPRHLAFHPDGAHAYVINELDSVVTVCSWDSDKGSLRPLAETRVVPADAEGENYPSEVVVSPDGRFVWAANRGHNSIAVLAVDEGGEGLELVRTVGCGGDWPRHLTLDPSGTRLYAANERSGDVTWFDIDQATGIPRQAGSLALPAVSCVLFG
ncbi:6-phosphogluconolactonase, cycloisomerase 2 family [Streptomyces sp. DvalAA-14]|uniref:lactonase family protein n=1 Tax=unclassified Streptomyces TaxID=2593676 RepID=UPI00081B904E|nr:lactonase family protein [Streptomyces sp. DvalAA-14]MYS21025.1 beta-propeller fold lactonase family protein [Streptomyces sp. SID4948]SCD82490.1 6-phosphogluconolactonase, cycloisomerase 2 family [Streptomyces sp. DvalAA-14]